MGKERGVRDEKVGSGFSFKLRYIAVVSIIGLLLFIVFTTEHNKLELKEGKTEFFTCEMELDLPALVSLPDVILVGNVSDIITGPNYTYINVSVSEYVKGSVPPPNESITIRMYGALSAPSFTINESLLLFLMNENDYFELASLGQGKSTVNATLIAQIKDILSTKLEDRTRKI